ncbi:hypothetical protein [Marinobacterium sp. BA1]|uniref:hypothetical protein n=1 Tax=Marinobacterium sp. BA1 TaxID=3138931 RepID=UPI0032E740C7
MSKNQRQRLSKNDLCTFIKSGNPVRLIEPHGRREWIVERTSGASKGKQMICRESALVPVDAADT